MKERYKIVSLFSGCGGLDLGFRQAGFDVIWANDIDSSVSTTYKYNHPNTFFCEKDINQLKPQDIPNCDGFIGGPPCQPWSIAGKQLGINDNRGKLFMTYIDLIKSKKPTFFLIENVKGLLDNKFKDIFLSFLETLEHAGYNVKWQLIDAINYRIPQNRERVFMVGFRKEFHAEYNFPLPIYPETITLEDAISDITEKPVKHYGNEKVKKNQTRPNHDVLATVFGDYYHKGNRRRGWKQPSFTIHATAENIPLHPASPQMMYYGHENWQFQKGKMSSYRRLSVRECARVQTFPDNFIFDSPDIKATYRMIGNAVPPRLAYYLAKSIYTTLEYGQIGHLPASDSQQKPDACVLVGYFKDSKHYNLILKNLLYYVRSDSRKGSILRNECNMIPKYLLLHHKNIVKIFELDGNEPVISNADVLATLGFNCSGKNYLCFRLKNGKSITLKSLGANIEKFRYNENNYAPYFTTIKKLTHEC